MNFDSDLSESRYYVVVAIFDQTITFRHKELQAATKAIHAAEAALAKKPNAEAAGLLKQARDLAFSPVVDDGRPATRSFLARLHRQQEGRRGEQAGHRPGRQLEPPSAGATTSARGNWPSRRWPPRRVRRLAVARCAVRGAAGVRPGVWLAGAAVLAFLLLFLVLPVGRVFITAFPDGDGGFTLGHFGAFFARR